MSNVDLIIEERAADIGNFMVGRLLPFRQKRMVGPFAFIDHMGPAEMTASENLDVPPHPHIGLSTLTFLFEGNILHKDSLGNEIEIEPGAVNWMTAGKGIVHSERTPERFRNQAKKLHGLQIWVALPKNLEEMSPQFTHVSKNEIPAWTEQSADFRLIAGEAFNKKSPVPVYSKLYFIEISCQEKTSIDIGKYLYGESALYILEGSITNQGNTYEPKRILVNKNPSICSFEMQANTTLYIFGGEVFPEERIIHWNFVASDKKMIAKAREKWENQEFDSVPGETDFVPLPK
ncbi:MAG: pirin family protein [Bacteroidota bacterium]